MDIASLKTMIMVREQGSIAAAARALDVDPSSVSRLVASVEASLGLRLFRRTTRSLSVTEEGDAYLARVAPLIEELERAREDARQGRARPEGLIKLTASVAFSHHVLLPVIHQFQQEYANVEIDLICTDENLDPVESGVDLAVRLAPAPKGNWIAVKLIDTHYRVVCSPDYVSRIERPLVPDQLNAMNCLRFALPGLRDVWRFRQKGGQDVEVPVSGSLTISSPQVLREAALSGLGVALLSDWMIDADIREGRLVDLFPDFECTASNFETAAWLLYPERQYQPLRTRLLIDHLRARLSRRSEP